MSYYRSCEIGAFALKGNAISFFDATTVNMKNKKKEKKEREETGGKTIEKNKSNTSINQQQHRKKQTSVLFLFRVQSTDDRVRVTHMF